eukprot:6205937-Pleurochrysis_carterae.AAC.1
MSTYTAATRQRVRLALTLTRITLPYNAYHAKQRDTRACKIGTHAHIRRRVDACWHKPTHRSALTHARPQLVGRVSGDSLLYLVLFCTLFVCPVCQTVSPQTDRHATAATRRVFA